MSSDNGSERREELLSEAMERLAEGVDTLRTGDGWRAWLDMANNMPSYSANNQLLLMIQKPDATMVAGFRQWRALGRNVIKGETALRVLAPMVARAKVDHADNKAAAAEATGATPPEPEDKDAKGDRRKVGIRGYKAVPVFDVSQTEGEPLPEPPRAVLLEGQAPEGLWDALAAQVAAAGFTLQRVASADDIYGANGLTEFDARRVSVRSDVSDAQAVKTLAHELAHVRLHDPTAEGGVFICRGEGEVEAESVAYLVSAQSGLRTDDYSFAYVARWAETAKPDVLSSTAERIRATARSILDTIDKPAADLVDEPAPATALVLPWRTTERSAVPLSVTHSAGVAL